MDISSKELLRLENEVWAADRRWLCSFADRAKVRLLLCFLLPCLI